MPQKKVDNSTAFSKFFREASAAEQKKVFLKVARQATEDQLKVMNSK